MGAATGLHRERRRFFRGASVSSGRAQAVQRDQSLVVPPTRWSPCSLQRRPLELARRGSLDCCVVLSPRPRDGGGGGGTASSMDSGQLQACPCSAQDAGRTVHRLPSRSEAPCVRRQEEWSWPRRVLAQRALTVTWRAQQAVGVAVAPDRRRRRVPLWRHQRGGFFQRIDDAAVAVIGETWYLSCRDRREWSRLSWSHES